MIPTLNKRGVFGFLEPYRALIPTTQILTVTAIRNITDFINNDEDPLNTIYIPTGLTETEFTNDVIANLSIVVFTTDGGEYIYVPENRVTTDADVTGYEYQERSLLVSLGHLPLDTDTSLTINSVSELIYDTLGVTPSIEDVKTSTAISIPESEHLTFQALVANRATVKKSYYTKYHELLELYNKQQVLIENLNQLYRDGRFIGDP